MAQITPSNLVPFTGTIQAGQRLLKHSDGTFIPVGATITTGPDTADGNITSDTVLSGYRGYNSSGAVDGGIQILAGSSYQIGSAGMTIQSGVYLGGSQTITLSSGYYNTTAANVAASDVTSGKVAYTSTGAVVGTHVCSGGSGGGMDDLEFFDWMTILNNN